MGTFDEIYNHPANEFVAGFIGEPPMNFLSREPFSDGGEVGLRAMDGSFKFRLPGVLASKLSKQTLKQVKLGIRPVDIVAKHTSALMWPKSKVRFIPMNYWGEEGQLAAKVGSHDVRAVTPPFDLFNRDQPVWLGLKPDRIHLFHGDLGIAL